MGHFKPIPASFLFVLCVLLCGFHLRSRVCIAFRNVSNPGAWTGHVHCRFCIVDRYILDWAAYPLDAPKSYPRRNILPVCCHVYSLHADSLETGAGDHRKIIGRD